MIERMKRVEVNTANEGIDKTTDTINIYLKRSRSEYFTNLNEGDPFLDLNVIDVKNVGGDESDREDIEGMWKRSKENGLPEAHWKEMETLVWEYERNFTTELSSTPANIEPIRIQLTEGARPNQVKLRNYSPSQRTFTEKLMKQIIDHNIIIANPT